MLRSPSLVLVTLQQAVTLSLLCDYQPYINTLHCQCRQDGLNQLDTRLRLDTFSSQLEVLDVQYCPHLVLQLDLVNVNATIVEVKFSQCNKVVIRDIFMETDYAGHQRLQLHFSNIQTVELTDLYLSDCPVNIQFENIQHVNIADSAFLNLTKHNIQSFNSGKICVKNSLLSRSENREVISACPWVASSSPSLLPDNNQIKPVKVSSSSTPRDNDKLTKPRYELQDHVLVPLSIGITIVLLFSIIASIFLVEKTLKTRLREKKGKSSENEFYLKPESDRSSFNGGISEKNEENSVSNDPLRRSISAVLLFSKNNQTATPYSVEHWISQTQDEYLC